MSGLKISTALPVTGVDPNDVTGVFRNNSNYQRLGGKEIPVVKMEDLGLPSFDMSRVISKMVKNSSRNLMDIMSQFTQQERTPIPIANRKRIWKQGVDIFERGSVVNTVTANGTGLYEIDITVIGPGGVNTDWYSVMGIFRGRDKRNYYVASISKNASYQQVLKLRPIDGNPDLVVANGQSTAFPDNYPLTEIRQGANLSCVPEVNQRSWNTTEYENYMSQTQKQVRRSLTQTQSGWASLVEGIPGYDGGIIAYISREEYMNYYEGAKMVSSGMLWDQRAYDSEAPDSGDGFLTQVSDTYKQPLVIADWKARPYDILNGYVRDWNLNDPGYLNDELICIMGTNAYADFQDGMTRSGNAPRVLDYRDAPKTGTEAMSELSAGFRYTTAYLSGGQKVVHVVCMDALDDPSLSGDGADLNIGTASIHSHDVVLVDPGMKRNKNLETGYMDDENEYKIGLFCSKNVGDGESLYFTNVTKPGLANENGDRITSGNVTSFDVTTTRLMQWTHMVNIEEEGAVLYLSPTN